MLPESFSQAYQDFVKKLIFLQNDIDSGNLDLDSLQKNFKIAQHFFQTSIVNLSDENLDLEISSRWRSLQTEIYRTFKLLEVEMMRLQSSKKSTTQQQRLKSISDRLSQSIGYCELIREQGTGNRE
jgi:hypothetical protein